MSRWGALVISIGELADLALGADQLGLQLDDHGAPRRPLLTVDLDVGAEPDTIAAASAAAGRAVSSVVIGVARRPLRPSVRPLTALLDTVLVPRGAGHGPCAVETSDPDEAAQGIAAAVARSPRAAIALVTLLRHPAGVDVEGGLAAESAAYSMLLAGPEFRRWRDAHPVRPPEPSARPVALSRDGTALCIELDRASRHNAFDCVTRDQLAEAFDLAALDPTIESVHLSGRGRSFCSGGDLDEFGRASDVASAHLIRLDRSVGARIHRVRERVVAHVHGACIGAGTELPAFAGQVRARRDAVFELPEVAMGLVPGAGGTVSVTARIGRWRTAYLALSGRRVNADTARRWGLVDEIDDG